MNNNIKKRIIGFKNIFIVFGIFFFTFGIIFPKIFQTMSSARSMMLQIFILTIGALILIFGVCIRKNHDLRSFYLYFTLILFLGFWRIFTYYAGGPISWDELQYINLSLNPSPTPSLLNRYFHIYLQKLFISLAGGDPFLGVKIFWSFLITSSAALTFINSFELAKHGTYITKLLTGTATLLLFFSFPYILDYPGVTYSDYTLVWLISILITLYLLYRSNKKHKHLILILMGTIFILVFKTKEIGVFLCILLLGIGIDEKDNFRLSLFLHNIKYFLVGTLPGFICIAILDQYFLNDLFFSFRILNWQALLDYHIRPRNYQGIENIFEVLGRSNVIYPFILALLSFGVLKREKNLRMTHKLLLLTTLCILLSIILSTITGARPIVIRFLVILAPILCIIATQFIPRRMKKTITTNEWFFHIVGSIITYYLIQNIIIPFSVSKWGWQRENFFSFIIAPILFITTISLFSFFDKLNFKKILAVFSIIFLLTCHPILIDLNNLHNKSMEKSSQRRFYPFEIYKKEILYSEEMTMYISPSFNEKYEMLGRDKISCLWFFNIFFQSNARIEQFEFYNFAFSKFINEYSEYAFLTNSDWESMTFDQINEVHNQYNISYDNYGFYFLEKY